MNSTNLLIISSTIILIVLIVYYGEVISDKNQQIISLINGTDGVYTQLETITTNTEELHPSQDIICRMLEGKLCEVWDYLQDNPYDTDEDAYNQNYYWHQ